MERTIGKPNLEVFAATVLELAQANRHVLAVTSDSRGSGKLVPLGEMLPDQIVEVGIAEQNLVGVAAGLASAGKTVFAVSPACFLATRALEQIKNDVAYSDNPVNLIGISAGVSYGALGSTHHSLHDFAGLASDQQYSDCGPSGQFRNTPGGSRCRVGTESRLPPVWQTADTPSAYSGDKFHDRRSDHPARRNRCGAGRHRRNRPSCVGRGRALQAEGVSTRVISMHTIKPLDTRTLLDAAADLSRRGHGRGTQRPRWTRRSVCRHAGAGWSRHGDEDRRHS